MSYEIQIKVVNTDNDEVVGKRETSSTEVAEQIIIDIPTWIKNYEEKNKMFSECDQCEKEVIENELSEVDDGGIKKLVCQNCLDELFGGHKQIKEKDEDKEFN